MYLAPNLEDATAIITHPDIYPNVIDDGSVPPDEFELPDGVMTIVCYDPKPAACTMFHWRNSVTVETHVQVLPEARRSSFKYGRAMVAWILDNMAVDKLIGLSHDRRTLLYALRLGFETEGVSKKSFMKNGQLIDETYVGLRR